MHEIAHHFALQREDLVDAYEIVVPPPDIGIDVVPTIVHVVGDTHITGTDRLVLVDVEYHAHRCERNFRTGPDVLRSVKPLSHAASRNEVLFKANVDRYCRNEGGRCLVFINGRRWPDYDFDRKSIAHGDYIRIAVPPSDRYSCPTAAISDMTQRGLSDQQILDEIYTDDAASGFSPSPLNEEEVRGLAARQVEDTDEVPLMQWTLANHHSHDLRDGWCDTNNTSNESIPEDWFLDLQRLVQGQMQRGDGPYPQELMFSVYTWYIDLGDSYICREPRIAMLGDDPYEWREDILEPWRHQIRRGDGVLIDLVSPHAPRAEIEEHIAHIIITQRPNELNPALLSLEFVDTTSPSVIVRFAIAVSETCSPPQIEELVPLYHSFAGNRQEWINPLISVLQSFQTRPGINLIVRIFPHVDENEEESQDVSLMQQYIVSSHPDGAAFGSCSNCCDEDRKQSGLSSEQISRKQVKGPAGPFTDFSLTEEFIRYIQAVGTQAEAPPALLEPPDGLRDQPVWVQDLWEKWVETIQAPVGDVPHGPRLETWFTNPRRWTRCEHSRVVVLSSNFHQWERELLAAWHDRADIALPTQFAIVFPTPPDADRSVQEQVVIEQQSEPFSRSIVVTVCDTARSSGRHGSLALVVSDRLVVQSLITLLGYSEICPPERTENECIMWMGNIAIRPDQVLNVRNGNALRFLVRRGIRIGIPELLSMTDGQLRCELQAAIDGAVYRRPSVPGYPADPHSINNPSPRHANASGDEGRFPPDWLNALQALFEEVAFVENSDEGRVIYVLVWFVNGNNRRQNDDPRVVRLDAVSQWWRSELIFPWRDSFERASPIDLYFVDPMPPRDPWRSHAAHIIVTQAVPDDHVAVLVTTASHSGPGGITAQEVRIVNQFSGVRDFFAQGERDSHTTSSVAASRGGLIFPDDHTVRVGNGDSILLQISYGGHTQVVHDEVHGQTLDTGDDRDDPNQERIADTEGHYVENDETDDSSLMQHSAGGECQSTSFDHQNDVSSAPACAIEIEAGAPRETDFFQFNPDADEFRPQDIVLPGWAQVIADIYQDWDLQAFAWQGESRASHFMTWFVAPGMGRFQWLIWQKNRFVC